MDRDQFVSILSPLVLSMRADFDKPTWTAYYQALSNIPAPLFQAAVAAVMQEAREFFPKANELRGHAERARLQVMAATPYEGCIACEHSRGWRAIVDDGIPRVQRCPCLERHRQTLAALGVVTDPLALMPARVDAPVREMSWIGDE